MMLPSDTELNEVAQLIGGVDFEDLGPEARIQIMTLALKAIEVEKLDDLDTRLAFVSDWFRCSKLYEP